MIAIISLLILCIGDGFSGVFFIFKIIFLKFLGLLGTLYGKKKLPWNKEKTFIGTFSFFIFSLLFCILYLELFYVLGWFYFEFYKVFFWIFFF